MRLNGGRISPRFEPEAAKRGRFEGGLIIPGMVINMNETRLCTIEQIEQFLSASAKVDFSAHGGDLERYAHIADVLRRFGYHQRNKHDRGVLLRYLQPTSGYSRVQLTRLVKQWHANRLAKVPLAKRYMNPMQAVKLSPAVSEQSRSFVWLPNWKLLGAQSKSL